MMLHGRLGAPGRRPFSGTSPAACTRVREVLQPGVLGRPLCCKAIDGSQGGSASAALNSQSSPLLQGSGELSLNGSGGQGLSGSTDGTSPAPTAFALDAADKGSTGTQPANPQPPSWESWLKHFETMDQLAESMAQLQVELADAVRQERYSDASRLKKQLQEAASADTVATVQRELQAALEAEQYSAAATLRDQGLVALHGWWAGKAGPDDLAGHLLHVKPEFGRWTGRVYTARDIAQMNGWRETKLMQLLDRVTGGRSGTGAAGGLQAAIAGASGTVGTPLMEVFVRPAEQAGAPAAAPGPAAAAAGTDGPLVHRAVALRPPAIKDDGSSRTVKAAAADAGPSSKDAGAQPQPAAKLDPSSVVRFSITLTADGHARIKVLPPQPIKSRFTSWEEEEMKATLAALAGDSTSSSTSSQAASPANPRSSSSALPRVAQRAGGSSSSPSSSVGEAAAASADSSSDFTDLVRVPAQVSILGRDRFTFVVQDDSQQSASASSSSSSSPAGQALPSLLEPAQPQPAAPAAAPLMEVELELVVEPKGSAGAAEVQAAAGRTLADADDDGDDVMVLDEDDEDDDDDESDIGVSLDLLSTGYGSVDAVATSASTAAGFQNILVEIPAGRLMRQQQQQQGAEGEAGPSGDRAGKDTFDRLAERIVQLQARRASRILPREQLAAAIRSLAQRVLAGEVPVGSAAPSALSSTPAALSQQRQQPASTSASSALQLQQAAGKVTRVAYSRLPTDVPRTDPLTGLYLGSFGQHGPELLQLARCMVDGEETVVATKVTGDPNVPAGEVSFRAKVSRKHRLSARDVYPDELGIVARYRGEGRVALAGFKSPRWVEGELLVFAVGASPLTSGAELGFVWSVPGEKRFLILLNKLDLKECER